MPSPLERLQRGFVAAVLEGDSGLAGAVRGGGRLTPAESVAVYARAYRARLSEALGETFQACRRVLGGEAFLAAGREYVARHPSRSHNLSDYGAEFPEFLRSIEAFSRAPFLPDLARFEWAFKELFHAAPIAGLPAAKLASRTRPGSRLRLGAHARLALEHRVYPIWKRGRADDSPLSPADWAGPERLLLYKAGDHSIFVRTLTAAELDVLGALGAGASLDRALESASGLDEAGARGLFSFLAESGLVAAVEP